MACKQIFEDRKIHHRKEQKINSMAWHRTDPDLFVQGDSNGNLKLWSIKKSKVISMLALSPGHQVFDLDWAEAGILAACESSVV
jgi:WD40 repeat protein